MNIALIFTQSPISSFPFMNSLALLSMSNWCLWLSIQYTTTERLSQEERTISTKIFLRVEDAFTRRPWSKWRSHEVPAAQGEGEAGTLGNVIQKIISPEGAMYSRGTPSFQDSKLSKRLLTQGLLRAPWAASTPSLRD